MPRTLYTLEVTITGGPMTDSFRRANPTVSRTIELRSDQTLNQLHYAIFEAFGRFDDCHLSEFQFGRGPCDPQARIYVLPFIYDAPEDMEPPPTGATTRTRLRSLGLAVGDIFWYWYDFGDDWWHEIRVLAVGTPAPKRRYPRVAARVGQSPPQYPPLERE